MRIQHKLFFGGLKIFLGECFDVGGVDGMVGSKLDFGVKLLTIKLFPKLSI